jgi:WD40 repeat protein
MRKLMLICLVCALALTGCGGAAPTGAPTSPAGLTPTLAPQPSATVEAAAATAPAAEQPTATAQAAPTLAPTQAPTLPPEPSATAAPTIPGNPTIAKLSFATPVNTVAYSPDGKLLAVGLAAGSIQLWDPAKQSKLAVLTGHQAAVSLAAFSPNGKQLASVSEDKMIIIWDVASRKAAQTLSGGSSVVAFSPDGKQLAAGGDSDEATLWNLATGEVVRTFPGHRNGALYLAFSPDGQWLATGSAHGKIFLWNLAKPAAAVRLLEGHSQGVWALAYSPDGKLLVSGSTDTTVRVWDADTGQALRVLEGHSDRVWSVAFSPDGRFLVSGGKDAQVIFWDPNTGAKLQAFSQHTAAVYGVAWAPDGRQVASGSKDQSVLLWDVASAAGAPVGEPPPATGEPPAPVVTGRPPASGAQLAFISTRSGKADLYLMNMDGSGVVNLTDNPAREAKPAWSPDGFRLAYLSAGAGKLNSGLYVMNADGTALTTIYQDQRRVGGFDWAPDGLRLVFSVLENEGDGQTPTAAIYVANVDGSGLKHIYSSSLRGAAAEVVGWSPDGNWLAFPGEQGGAVSIFSARPDGSEVTNLTASPSNDFFPSWAPDSSRIIFSRGALPIHALEATEIHLAFPGTRTQSFVNAIAGGALTGPYAWLDNNRVAFCAANLDGDYGLYSMLADGRELTRLAANVAYQCGRPAVSADGAWLALIDAAGNLAIVPTAQAASDPPLALTTTRAESDPAWRP